MCILQMLYYNSCSKHKVISPTILLRTYTLLLNIKNFHINFCHNEAVNLHIEDMREKFRWKNSLGTFLLMSNTLNQRCIIVLDIANISNLVRCRLSSCTSISELLNSFSSLRMAALSFGVSLVQGLSARRSYSWA